MKRILLVSPDSDNESLWITGEEKSAEQVKNNMVPLGLATVAALTPPGFKVDIWDELVHGVIDAETELPDEYDLVGITGFKTHMPRCRAISEVFRKRGVPVAIGGPGVSGTPDAYWGDFDILFIGEVENTWPRFLRDWERGDHKNEYRQIEKPDLADSPMPRWDSLVDVFDRYAMGCVQTTRGCPFDCEFCDVIYLFGRRARHKPVDRILEEVKALERLGVTSVFFCDDEFIGDPRYAKELLRALVPLNNSFAKPLTYSTQLTMNLSKDDELLELMADANFNLVFIGIETPNKESLKETSKHQNVRRDLAGDVHKILSYGISIRAGIIVGFDHDDRDIFDIQYDFIQEARLPSLAINMLKAPLGTRLWTRLRQQGRVITLAKVKDRLGHARSYTNVMPKMMSRVELMEGYLDLQQRLHGWDAFAERMCGFVSLVKRKPDVNEEPLTVEEARRLCAVPSVDSEGLACIDRILESTERQAPFMMRRVKTAIIQFAKFRETLTDLVPQLERQIDIESRGEFPLEPEQRPIPVPDSFRSEYRKIFPGVYGRAEANVTDKGRLPEALTEIFVDFLVRWGKEFDGLEPYHATFLNEITDRTCAKINGVEPQSFVPKEPTNGSSAAAKRTRLAEDVLKSVEHELLKFVLPKVPA